MNNLPLTKPVPQYEVEMGMTGPMGVHDTMRLGRNQIRSNLAPIHPVEQIQSTHANAQDEIRLTMLASVSGMHAPMRIRMERALVTMPNRMPCISRTNLGLQTLMGRDETIDYCDYLN
eukprot:Ihof_evm8s269 gene=Ihof_evmTU8s269